MGKIVANLTREQIEAIGDALDLIGSPWSVASSGESLVEDLFAGEGGADAIKGALVWLAHAQKDMMSRAIYHEQILGLDLSLAAV
jgi:hypothetical protein